MELMPHQRDGVDFLSAHPRALLADEPGVGKSAQAVCAARRTRPSGTPKGIVVCPASVVPVWRREFGLWNMDAGLWEIVSYDKATRSPPKGPFDVVILDEAHYLKTPTAKRTKAVFGEKCDGKGGIIEGAGCVWALTGTPTPNNPSELWPMMRAMFPELILHPAHGRPRNWFDFRARYCKLQFNGFDDVIVGAKNIPELKLKLNSVMLRRKKADVLKDLPPLRVDLLPLDVPVPSRKVEDEARAVVEAHGEQTMHLATYRRATGLAKVPAVIKWIETQLEGGLKKLVVFAQHTEVIEKLAQAFRYTRSVMLTGASSAKVREWAVHEFQTDQTAPLFFGQLQAAGTGITLTAASDVLFVESSWVPAENEQAAMRIHRIGQKNACLVRFATIPGSLDEQIQRACARKISDINALFN